MGRAFELPKGEVWVNIGWCTGSNQLYPATINQLGLEFDRPWHDLVTRIKTHTQGKEVDECQAFGMTILCAFVPCTYPCLMMLPREFNNGLTAACREFTALIGVQNEAVTWKLDQMSKYTTAPLDQYGKRCERSTAHGLREVWPPMGYNIILNKGMLARYIGRPIPALPPGMNAQAMWAALNPNGAAGGGVDITTELTKLASLHQQGVLTDSEFAAGKAKILQQNPAR